MTHANLDEHGAIASVGTRDGETIAADLFVDCTGFAGLLITKALKTPFVSFMENLFNDAAVAMPTPIGDTVPSQTVSTALNMAGPGRSRSRALRQRLRVQHPVLHSG